jgi:hypothetical protein
VSRLYRELLKSGYTAGSPATASQYCPFRPLPAVLDDSANALFMTEIFRGMAYTIKAYFEPKVTVSGARARFAHCCCVLERSACLFCFTVTAIEHLQLLLHIHRLSVQACQHLIESFFSRHDLSPLRQVGSQAGKVWPNAQCMT